MDVYFLLLLIFCFAFVISLPATATVISPDPLDDNEELFRPARIIGGKVVPDDAYKFVVLIYVYCNSYTCTGSVISKKHVLTAAHCVTCVDPDKKTGAYTLHLIEKIEIRTRGSALYDAVNKLLPHRSVQFFPFPKNDVAIVELIPGKEFDVLPVKLAAGIHSPEIQNLTALGYGQHEERLDNGTLVLRNDTQLRVVDVPLFRITSNAMFGGRARQMMYRGDSGGPLVKYVNGSIYQFGLSSANLGNDTQVLSDDPDNRRIIDLYMKTPAYCDFVKTFTQGLTECEIVP